MHYSSDPHLHTVLDYLKGYSMIQDGEGARMSEVEKNGWNKEKI